MVSAVISSFVICWTPMQIYLLYTHHNQVTFIFAILAQSLVYISACVNPILYAFLSQPFRKAFQQFLTCSKLLSNHFVNAIDHDTSAPGKSTSYRTIKEQHQHEKKSLALKSTANHRKPNDITSSTALVSESVPFTRAKDRSWTPNRNSASLWCLNLQYRHFHSLLLFLFLLHFNSISINKLWLYSVTHLFTVHIASSECCSSAMIYLLSLDDSWTWKHHTMEFHSMLFSCISYLSSPSFHLANETELDASQGTSWWRWKR